MKRIFLLILVSALSTICTVALPKNKVDAVTMESYEQNWDDNVGTIALKNNTNQDIYNVTFQLIYLDMSGKQLDYEEFSQNVDIAPGMTKKINITAYESSRDYSYYKSEAGYLHPKRFKIKYELKAYNSDTSQTGDDEYDSATSPYQSYSVSNNTAGWESLILILLLFIIAAVFYVPLIILARNYGRSVTLCILLSFLTTPIVVIIVLLIIGKKNDTPQNRY